ncbi:hypothetical protein BST12_06695 [Mycobacterium angelicum]|uniref:Uncharacterized protein n=1 Tax=Mycobacterium angelicum TaxID=470074 RepID=A0A1X0A1A2_MYCAN|nr:hypothetical protein BST12_06695 [Mycobacterium angelicum]
MTAAEGHYGWTELLGADPRKLVAMARQRESEFALEPARDDHRSVINMLRHDFTNYDGNVYRSVTDRLYEEILDAIARDFPWLAHQCAYDKAGHPQRVPSWVAARRSAHREAQARQQRAREMVKHLHIGKRVMVSWRGSREATIIEIRRTQVRAAFTLPNGNRHVITRSAHEVQPIPLP